MGDPAAIARQALGLGNYAKADRGLNKMYDQNGLKSSNYPNAKRSGIASILDRNIRRGDFVKNRDALGEGAVSMIFFDENGEAITGPEASLSLHDVTFTADKAGRFRLVDEGFLLEKENEEKQKRAYIDMMTDRCVTDLIMVKMLGISEADFETITKSGGGEEVGVPSGLRESNARPSVLESYVPASQLYMESLAKQRAIIRHFMPILQKKSESGTGNLDAKDSFVSKTNAEVV